MGDSEQPGCRLRYRDVSRFSVAGRDVLRFSVTGYQSEESVSISEADTKLYVELFESTGHLSGKEFGSEFEW